MTSSFCSTLSNQPPHIPTDSKLAYELGFMTGKNEGFDSGRETGLSEGYLNCMSELNYNFMTSRNMNDYFSLFGLRCPLYIGFVLISNIDMQAKLDWIVKNKTLYSEDCSFSDQIFIVTRSNIKMTDDDATTLANFINQHKSELVFDQVTFEKKNNILQCAILGEKFELTKLFYEMNVSPYHKNINNDTAIDLARISKNTAIKDFFAMRDDTIKDEKIKQLEMELSKLKCELSTPQ